MPNTDITPEPYAPVIVEPVGEDRMHILQNFLRNSRFCEIKSTVYSAQGKIPFDFEAKELATCGLEIGADPSPEIGFPTEPAGVGCLRV